MAGKVSRRLSYDPTPNMAGLFADEPPPAPAPVPPTAQLEPEAPPLSQSSIRTETSSYPPARQPPMVPRSESRAPAPVAYAEPPIARATSTPRPPPDRKPAKSAPAPKPPRAPAPRAAARSQPVVSSERRVRRTLRIPLSFDKKLRELATVHGVNLNSAVLAAIDAEWQRAVAERRRA